MGVVSFDTSRVGDNGAAFIKLVGECGRSEKFSSSIFWDEKDGPNVDSRASAEGTCAIPTDGPDNDESAFRGERGIFARGLFANNETELAPLMLAAASCCQSVGFDFAALMPLRRLDPYDVASPSFGDKFNALMRLQSLEKTSSML